MRISKLIVRATLFAPLLATLCIVLVPSESLAVDRRIICESGSKIAALNMREKITFTQNENGKVSGNIKYGEDDFNISELLQQKESKRETFRNIEIGYQYNTHGVEISNRYTVLVEKELGLFASHSQPPMVWLIDWAAASLSNASLADGVGKLRIVDNYSCLRADKR